eukprot:1675526-Rhodomonas_salina.2
MCRSSARWFPEDALWDALSDSIARVHLRARESHKRQRPTDTVILRTVLLVTPEIREEGQEGEEQAGDDEPFHRPA